MTPPVENGGRCRAVLPGVHLVELPLPSALGRINVYLVRLSDGYLLVDCGMNTEPAFEALAGALEVLGIGWRDIRQILLTHIHPDHMGLAPRLLRLTGARLLLHHLDKALLDDIAAHDAFLDWTARVMTDAGASAEMIAQVAAASSEIMKDFQRLEPEQLLAGGERILTAAGELEVLWTPGHSPGHISLYEATHRALFSGDAVLEDITPNIGWRPDRDALAEYLHTLRSLAVIDVDLILPSHGEPFSGHRAWIEQTLAHHEGRCDCILTALRDGPSTPHTLVGHVWPRRLAPVHYRFAIFEVLAHLEYLERQGRVRRLDAVKPLCYSLTTDGTA